MNRNAWQGFAGVVTLVAATGWSRPAAACGMCDCQGDTRPIINLIRGVPLNLQIPLRLVDETEVQPRIERVSDGMQAAATVTRDEAGAAVWWLRVDQDLEPNTEYRIVGGEGVGAQFTTGVARDELSPTLVGASTMAGGNGALCDVQVGGQVALEGAADNGDNFAVWVELEIDVASTAQHVYADHEFGSVRLGHSMMGCFGPTELGDILPGDYPGRVRLVDAAGNLGEWQNFVLPVVAESPGGCGTPMGSAGTASVDPSQPPNASGGTAGAADADARSPRTSQGCALVPARPGGSSRAVLAGLLTLAWLLVRRRCATAC